MVEQKKVPISVTDILLHAKADENCEDDMERVIMPITRYENVLNSPSVVSDTIAAPGAPFVLFKSKERQVDLSDIRDLCGDIL